MYVQPSLVFSLCPKEKKEITKMYEYKKGLLREVWRL